MLCISSHWSYLPYTTHTLVAGDRQLGRAVRGRARLRAGGAELRAVQTTNGMYEMY